MISTALTRFRGYLARPVDASSLGFLRIWFGCCMFINAIRYWNNISEYWLDPNVFFPLPGFGLLRPWPGYGMYVHYVVMGLAAAYVAIGMRYRLAIITLFLAHTYVFVLEESYYLNHFYLISLIAFLLIWMPADRWGSLRLGSRPNGTAAAATPATVPTWTIFLLRTQLFLVYFFAGVAKLNTDWLQGHPISDWLLNETDLPVIGPWLDHPYAGLIVAWGGMLYDLSVGFLLLWRPTRIIALAWSAMFHFINALFFDIGIFPTLSMGASLIFLEPDWPRQLGHHLRRLAFRRSPPPAFVRAAQPPTGPSAPLLGRVATTLLGAYIVVQVVLPLRHWLIPGDVAWTEEGHILSWRMKLRDKQGKFEDFAVVRPSTGERVALEPDDYVTTNQHQKLTCHPRVVWRFAQWVAKRYEKEWGERPRVYVNLQVSLNGRAYQAMIDTTADLAAVHFGLTPNRWILPLTTPLPED